jgi:hypothetical protein
VREGAVEEPWGAALRTYFVARTHELSAEDFPATDQRPEALPVEPFDVELARSRYAASLAEAAGQRPGWRSMAWQGAWAQRAGGLDPVEARWWWRAWCAPAAWTDTRGEQPGLALLGEEDAALSVDEVRAMWRALVATCGLRLSGAGWWFGLMWAPRLWLAWLPAEEVFSLLADEVPAEQVRHLWGALGCRDAGDDAALNARADAYLAGLTLDTSEARYTAIRLLEVVPGASRAPLFDALFGATGALVEGEVARAALALAPDEAVFLRGVEELPYPIRVESVAEVLARGGYAGLGVWCRRLAGEPASELVPLLPIFLLIHAPEVVPVMLAMLRHGPVMRAVYGWIIEEGANAVAGLLESLGSPRPLEAVAAARLLAEFYVRGHGAMIERVAADASEGAQRAWAAQSAGLGATK